MLNKDQRTILRAIAAEHVAEHGFFNHFEAYRNLLRNLRDNNASLPTGSALQQGVKLASRYPRTLRALVNGSAISGIVPACAARAWPDFNEWCNNELSY